MITEGSSQTVDSIARTLQAYSFHISVMIAAKLIIKVHVCMYAETLVVTNSLQTSTIQPLHLEQENITKEGREYQTYLYRALNVCGVMHLECQ